MDVKNFTERTPYFELSHTSPLIYNFENKAFTIFIRNGIMTMHSLTSNRDKSNKSLMRIIPPYKLLTAPGGLSFYQEQQ